VDNVGRGKNEPGVGLDGEDDSSVNVEESGLSVGDLVIGDHVGIERDSNLIGVSEEGGGEGSEVAERVGRRDSFKKRRMGIGVGGCDRCGSRRST